MAVVLAMPAVIALLAEFDLDLVVDRAKTVAVLCAGVEIRPIHAARVKVAGACRPGEAASETVPLKPIPEEGQAWAAGAMAAGPFAGEVGSRARRAVAAARCVAERRRRVPTAGRSLVVQARAPARVQVQGNSDVVGGQARQSLEPAVDAAVIERAAVVSCVTECARGRRRECLPWILERLTAESAPVRSGAPPKPAAEGRGLPARTSNPGRAKGSQRCSFRRR